MANLTENGHHKMGEVLSCTIVHGPHHHIFLAAFNILLSVVATVGNVLILIALHKASSLHPPSKLLFRCLAITDLCVGLIIQPMFAAVLMFEINKLRQVCEYFSVGVNIAGVVFSGVSLMTVAAVSVDRLLALSLGLRYRQIVTLRRVGSILTFLWIICIAGPLLQEFRRSDIVSNAISAIIILCLVASAYCYMKIFLRLRQHQVQMQGDDVHRGQLSAGGGIPLNIARYRKTVSAALWVQITLVACYLPDALLLSVASLLHLSEASIILVKRYATSLVYLNSSLNPFLYCWKIREVRQAVKEMFTC